jgi:hypothetical protein
MRIAISCFAFPDFGRPTRRARLNSSPVDSGRSEKSIRSSCVGFALFRARTARGDDTKRFFAIFHPPIGINQNDDAALSGDSQSFETVLIVGAFRVFPLEGIGIGKNSGRFLERDAMFFKIPGGFSASQANTIYVYTIMRMHVSSLKRFWRWIGLKLCGCLWKSISFDWLTSILTGSIKILTQALSTARANKAGSIRAQE